MPPLSGTVYPAARPHAVQEILSFARSSTASLHPGFVLTSMPPDPSAFYRHLNSDPQELTSPPLVFLFHFEPVLGHQVL